ncbi:MAG: L-threonylcarbamoyladenylate synthase [Nitrospirae bacterium]|jgi:L-threonylcarbamoyladenylate synthase|nr:L-threonylcarbamoyladenylate synthase [Nitrospirota bacterium]
MSTICHFSEDLSPSLLQEIHSCLAQDGVLSVPTESFYALSAPIDNTRSLRRLRAIKQLPAEKPLLVLIGERAELSQLTSDIPPAATLLIQAYWPGPLTLVFPASPHLPEELTGGIHTIGIRQPGDRRLCALLQEVGPLTGTSANHTGALPARTAKEVQQLFEPQVDLILDGGEAPGGMPSTILSLVGEVRLLRQGPITETQINQVLTPLGLTIAQ